MNAIERVTSCVAVILAICLPTVASAQAPSDALSSGFVKTPGGLIHNSCVHPVPDGASVDSDGNIVRDGVLLEHVDGCRFGRPPQINSWVIDAAQTVSSTQIGSTTASLVVPGNPSHNTTARLEVEYFFIGAEPACSALPLLQPVLQWGVSPAGGGNFWAIANWYIDSSGNAFPSNFRTVNAGDLIFLTLENHGIITAGGKLVFKWLVRYFDTTANAIGIYEVHLDTSILLQYATLGVFEAYQLNNCNELPSNSIILGNIGIVDSNGTHVPFGPSLDDCASPVGLTPACGYLVSSGPGSRVDLHWSNSP
jgi:hypothetical protein